MFFATSRKLIISALFWPAFFWTALAVHAQDATPNHERIDQLMHNLNRGHSVGQVAVSPDGRQLAWIEGARGSFEIHVAPRDDLGKFVRVTAAKKPEQHCAENEITWSPNSSSIAFFSDCADPGGQTDLYVSHVDRRPCAPRHTTQRLCGRSRVFA